MISSDCKICEHYLLDVCYGEDNPCEDFSQVDVYPNPVADTIPDLSETCADCVHMLREENECMVDKCNFERRQINQ